MNSYPIVDRESEQVEGDPEVVVTLKDGYTERFFLKGLSDEEYVKRARILRELERREHDYESLRRLLVKHELLDL